MLTKNDIKLIKSLKTKKYRFLNKMFIVEGKKSIIDFLNSEHHIVKLFSVNNDFDKYELNSVKLSYLELKKISYLKNPDDHLAIIKISVPKMIDENKLIIGLENISDPGNLGAIIRICDWFGIKDIICSKNSVDCYNSKVVQASMGSLSRVNINYLDFNKYLNSKSFTKAGTFLEGKSIYLNKISFSKGIIVFGNEANGISPEIEKKLDIKYTIPRFNNSKNPESLNLASSVSIVLSELLKSY
ncbi:MAG: RNA methyltransferase [Flavobacteriaceae bacterium]|nr:RNA methyltransferase [Flavobacteriaceae bacterium]